MPALDYCLKKEWTQKCSAEEEEPAEIAEKERPERAERIKPARRRVSSRREGSRGQMKLEDPPPREEPL